MIESEFRRAVVRAEDRLDVAHNEHVLPLFEWGYRPTLGLLDRELLQIAVLGHLATGGWSRFSWRIFAFWVEGNLWYLSTFAEAFLPRATTGLIPTTKKASCNARRFRRVHNCRKCGCNRVLQKACIIFVCGGDIAPGWRTLSIVLRPFASKSKLR